MEYKTKKRNLSDSLKELYKLELQENKELYKNFKICLFIY